MQDKNQERQFKLMKRTKFRNEIIPLDLDNIRFYEENVFLVYISVIWKCLLARNQRQHHIISFYYMQIKLNYINVILYDTAIKPVFKMCL